MDRKLKDRISVPASDGNLSSLMHARLYIVLACP